MDIIDNQLDNAFKKGDLKLIQSILPADVFWYNRSLCFACLYGHFELVNFLINLGAVDWNSGLNGACRGGHLEIVKLMIEKGANDWYWGMHYAIWANLGLYGGDAICDENCIQIMKLMIENGGNNWSVMNEKQLYLLFENGLPLNLYASEIYTTKFTPLLSAIDTFKKTIQNLHDPLIPPLLHLIAQYSLS